MMISVTDIWLADKNLPTYKNVTYNQEENDMLYNSMTPSFFLHI